MTIITLIIINLSVLAWMWFSPQGMQGLMSPERIEKSLNFNKEQDKQFTLIKDKHFAEVNPIRDSIKIIKSQLIDYIKREKPDNKILDEKLNLLTNKIKENEEKTLKHFIEVRAICDEKQKAIFDNNFLEKFKMHGSIAGGQPEGNDRAPRPDNPPPR